MNSSSRVFVCGGETLLGRALLQRLAQEGCSLVGVGPDEPDPTLPSQVEDFFAEVRPEYVFLTAGKSGGIGLNRARPAELMLHNLLATATVLEAAARHKVRKLLYLASSCSYPRDAAQPMRVDSLLTGPLEPTNAAYATAKLAGWQLARAFRQQEGAPFITGIPANPFGPGDDFDPESGHVLPALLRRCHEARRRDEPTLTVWGSGKPRREFIFSRDLADACIFAMRHYDGDEPINLGGGESLSIAEAARHVAEVVGYRGQLVFDTSRPDGMPLKMLDSTPLQTLGWRPSTSFRDALSQTYHWFVQHEVMEDHADVPAAVPLAVSHPPG